MSRNLEADDLGWRQHIDLQCLAAWMETQGFEKGPIAHTQRLSGGTQNIFISFTQAGRRFVLRRLPAVPQTSSNETMRREPRVLAALGHSEVPHPKLITACPDETVLGVA